MHVESLPTDVLAPLGCQFHVKTVPGILQILGPCSIFFFFLDLKICNCHTFIKFILINVPISRCNSVFLPTLDIISLIRKKTSFN